MLEILQENQGKIVEIKLNWDWLKNLLKVKSIQALEEDLIYVKPLE